MIRFAAIGLNHGHIYHQASTLIAAGCELVAFYATEPELIAPFQKEFPFAKLARSVEEILEDESISLITTAAIPDERSTLGVAAMRHGKDVLADKPGCTTLEQLAVLRKVQQETGRMYAILYSERMESPSTIEAGRLVKSGAIGQVVQTMGWGPHRINIESRAPWFFEREKYGGILCDLGSHQCEQYLYFSGAKDVQILSSQVGNIAHPEYSGLEDFGDATLRGKTESGEVCGYFRVDWFTPDGMPAFGDVRFFVIGTQGTIELRKYCDVGGREGSNHFFLTDNKSARYIDCSRMQSTFGQDLVHDFLHRSETVCSQQHYFAAAELCLRAQAQAQKFGHLKL